MIFCNLAPDEVVGVVVTFPDVPEAITGGENRPVALQLAGDALATVLAGYVHEKWEIPVPSDAARLTLCLLYRNSKTC